MQLGLLQGSTGMARMASFVARSPAHASAAPLFWTRPVPCPPTPCPCLPAARQAGEGKVPDVFLYSRAHLRADAPLPPPEALPECPLDRELRLPAWGGPLLAAAGRPAPTFVLCITYVRALPSQHMDALPWAMSCSRVQPPRHGSHAHLHHPTFCLHPQ